MTNSQRAIMNDQYSIPSRLRRMENLHILFWLLKDMSWCLNFKILAIIMIFPTLLVAIYITNRNKHIISELMHNLAVIFWITANSTWMLFEFVGLDETNIIWGIEGRYIALLPFILGLIILIVYYVFLQKKLAFREKDLMQ